MKLIICLALTAISFIGISQDEFNYEKDFKNILEKTQQKGKLNYQKLLDQFQKNDTSMTNFEVLALMIGFTAQEEYEPYQDLDIERELYRLNDEEYYGEALSKGLEHIRAHPVSVKALVEVAYAKYHLGQEDSANYYMFRAHRVMNAMYFSGEGLTSETATFSLGPTDGQTYIFKYLDGDVGTMGSGKDANGNFLDILQYISPEGEYVDIHFNIQHAFEKMFAGVEESIDEEKK